jgi:hypothetical protein
LKFLYLLILTFEADPIGRAVLRRGRAAARLWGLRVRIPPGALMSVSCECCVLKDRGLCFGLITRPVESYRVWCFWVWSWSLDNEEALAHWGLLRHGRGEGNYNFE